jgi:CRISPR/Cas system-associated exonuclease Cas4 (RecB family)
LNSVFNDIKARSWNKKPILCEEKFEIKLTDDITITGIIDLGINIDGILQIIDWKSARTVPSPDEVRTVLVQPVLYSLATISLVNNLKNEVILYYIRSKIIYKQDFNIDDYMALLSRIKRMIARIETNDYKPTANKSCRYCPLNGECDATRR